MRRRHHPLRFLQELTLPAQERRAAQDERRAEDAIRRERDHEETVTRRVAALDAERHRHSPFGGPPGGI